MSDPQSRVSEAVLVSLAKPHHGVGTISAYLRRAIETGAYSEGDRLPPERQLAATFQAARSTVRRALDQLERAGLVSRRWFPRVGVSKVGGKSGRTGAVDASPPIH